MTFPENPNIWMTTLFFLAVAISGFLMKLIVLLLPPIGPRPRTYRFWLLLAPTSHLRLRPMVSMKTLVLPTCLSVLSVLTGCMLFHFLVDQYKLPLWMQSYLATPLLFLMTDLLHRCFTLLWLPSGKLLPALHHRPWLAHSIADFWGKRWNLWFSDWFRYAIFRRLRRRPLWGIIIAFLISGIIHEWVLNVPLYFVAGVHQFGSMMIYFLIQAFGILLERALKLPRLGAYILTWVVVVGPSLLVVNEGLLRIMHLYAP